MAREAYKVPTALNRSYLDHELNLSVGGFNVPPTPIKQVLFFLVMPIGVLWASTQTFIKDSSPGPITLFVIWSLIAILYLGRLTKTKELRLMTIPAVVAYAPPSARKVLTRRSSDPSAFFSIVGIRDIDEDALITFADGTYGQVYLVVGSASFLLFDEDRVDILNRVDAFWRKVRTDCEWIFMTTKEPQRIYHQVAHLERRNQRLEVRDPDLLELQNEQYDILTQHVGGKFTSIHQYVLAKAKSMDALRQADVSLQAEIESSTLMFKDAIPLDREESIQTLKVLYQGVETRSAA